MKYETLHFKYLYLYFIKFKYLTPDRFYCSVKSDSCALNKYKYIMLVVIYIYIYKYKS